jgi:hypothetical protein
MNLVISPKHAERMELVTTRGSASCAACGSRIAFDTVVVARRNARHGVGMYDLDCASRKGYVTPKVRLV